MNTRITHLSDQQRGVAVQRLTALWAFSECGLGGMLHALQVPFTGLIAGGIAVLLITLIAFFSQHNYRALFHSLLIVLIIKAMVSPYTPFAAYIAVSFQALMGYTLFSLFGINLLSIVILSVITMIESAIQKLLTLTIFFGQSFWNAADDLVNFITKQLGSSTTHGSLWIMGIYLLIYVLGGFFFAWIAYKTIKEIFIEKEIPVLEPLITSANDLRHHNKKFKKLWGVIAVLLFLSLLLFLFADDHQQGWIAVIKTLSWTTAVILLWYFFISPLFTRFIHRVLKQKSSRYSVEIADTISFLPELRQLAALAWQKSKQYRGWRRLRYFCSRLVHWSLTCSFTNNPINKPV